MNNKNLASLALILAVLVGLFYLSNNISEQKNSNPDKKLLFSELPINSIRGLELKRKDKVVGLELKDSVWTVKAKDNYPADFGKVKSLLLKILELSVSQEITRNDEKHVDLGVNSSSNEFSHGEISFKGVSGENLGGLILGKFRAPKTLSNPALGTGQFVRKSESSEVYLISEPVSITMGDTNWLDKDLANINPLRVDSVSQTVADKSVFELKGNGTSFDLTPKPLAGHEVNDANVKLLTSALENFKLDDAQLEKSEASSSLEFNTSTIYKINNGLVFKVESAEVKSTKEVEEGQSAEPSEIFVKLSVDSDASFIESLKVSNAAAIEAQKAEAASKSEESGGDESTTLESATEEPKKKLKNIPPVTPQELEQFKSKFSGWVFKVPNYESTSKFRFDLSDLTRKIEVEEEVVETDK